MIGIYVKLPKRIAADAERMEKLRQPLAIADVMADIVRDRVAFDGNPVGARRAPPKYENAVGAYWLLAGVTRGVRTNGSQREDYDITRPNAWAKVQNRWRQAGRDPATFSFTGGMWSGLRVAASGAKARIRFAGSSLGRDGTRVPNEQKAGRVFKATGINVLEPTEAEISAAAQALGIEVQRLASALLGAEGNAGPVTGLLVQRFVAAFE